MRPMTTIEEISFLYETVVLIVNSSLNKYLIISKLKPFKTVRATYAIVTYFMIQNALVNKYF